MTGWLWLGGVMCSLALAVVGLAALGSQRWADRMAALNHALEAGRNVERARPPQPTRFEARELEGLPAPVQRYFRAVLKEGQPLIAAAIIEMTGTINLSATGEQWKSFTSRQRVAIRRPGFIWDAQVAMLPGLPVRVVDSYIAGKGLLHAAVLGLFRVADVSGEGEIARGELMRYFAEAPWYPTALLPSQGVQWAALDDQSAYATLVDGALALTLRFRFNEAGLIDSVRAEARGVTVGKEIVMMPWECSFSDYQVRGGMRVPLSGEAAYARPEGRKPYFIGTLKSLRYEFGP